MDKISKETSFCSICFLQFGKDLARFNTSFAIDLHLSTTHKKKIREAKVDTKNKFHEVHEREKPFKCERCNSSFVTMQSMNQHVASIHEKKKPFKCQFCNMASTCCDKGRAKILCTATLRSNLQEHLAHFWTPPVSLQYECRSLVYGSFFRVLLA